MHGSSPSAAANGSGPCPGEPCEALKLGLEGPRHGKFAVFNLSCQPRDKGSVQQPVGRTTAGIYQAETSQPVEFSASIKSRQGLGSPAMIPVGFIPAPFQSAQLGRFHLPHHLICLAHQLGA